MFSVHQMDIIVYGGDLRRYWACEFEGLPYADAVGREVRTIRFWSDVSS